jgi:hypothetical protein
MSITSFDDFCLWVYVVVDDGYQTMRQHFKRPGPAPTTWSDSEILAVALISECCGWDVETDLLQHWRAHSDLFPHPPSQSRFNRRRRALYDAFNGVRRWLLGQLDLSADRYGVIDSLPVPVVAFHHAPRCNRQWRAEGASFGKVSAKQMTFFGYKLHLLSSLSGVILDWVLAPANERDLAVAEELLPKYPGRTILGDKAYISLPVAEWLHLAHDVTLLTLPRANQRRQVPTAWHKPFNDARRIIETVNSQLAEQFHIERNHALSLVGLCVRIATKITAHVCCVFLNRLLGNPDWLHIKALPFLN